jgi:hypothetical protein
MRQTHGQKEWIQAEFPIAEPTIANAMLELIALTQGPVTQALHLNHP